MRPLNIFKSFIALAALLILCNAKYFTIIHMPATQLNEVGTSGMWQFYFTNTQMNLNDTIMKYWPVGNEIDSSAVVHEVRVH